MMDFIHFLIDGVDIKDILIGEGILINILIMFGILSFSIAELIYYLFFL